MNERLAALFASLSSASTTPTGPVTHIIVGLGNPGAQYDKTRHNVGFHAIDKLAAEHHISITRSRFSALCGEGTIEGAHVLLMKPQTFMNLSGDAVAEAANYYHIPADHILIFCDDISFEPGHLRIRRKGSAGGHNGLKSIIFRLGTDTFPRMKIGVGQKPHPDYDLADWVLSNIPDDKQKDVSLTYDHICKATLLWLKGNIEQAMNTYSN